MKFSLRVITFVLTLLMSWMVCSTAFAQSITDELPTPEAKRAWNRGLDLMDIKRWTDARIQFQAVYRDTKNARVLHNIAVCFKEDGFFAQAIGTWEKQLAQRAKLSEKEVKRAEDSIKIVQVYVTTLTLKSNQAGATLFIKGIEMGTTPFLGTIPIDQGKNEIELRKPGFETIKKTVNVEQGKPIELTLDMIPAKKTGTVNVSVTGPENAVVFMDGLELGPAPYKGPIAVGEHTFRATAKGWEDGIQTSKVEFGKELNITIAMVQELKEGKVRIKVDQADAVISIDGKVRGKGDWEGLLPEGGHKLVIEKEGFQTYEEELAVATDQERVLDIKLEQDMVSYWVFWAVTGVVVAAGAGVTSYFVLRPSEEPLVQGTLAPGTVPTNVGLTLFSF